MRIYTKLGDGGHTHLFGGKHIAKNDMRVQAYGDVDELNSCIGWVKSQLKPKDVLKKLDVLQEELFVLGADLATPLGTHANKPIPRMEARHVTRLEQEIDKMQTDLPPLQTFILPGGSPAGAALHWARSICRRAERSCVYLLKENKINPSAQIYLNRLSDYLFVLARHVNHLEDQPETPWVPKD